MHGINRKDIQEEALDKADYTYISLMPDRIRIGVVGGGRGGQIKTRHFVNNKCKVEVISKDFSEEIIELAKENPDYLTLINKEFTFEFLNDKHLIIIACDDEILNESIRKYCDEKYKIYIDSTDFTKGMGVVPTERSSRTMNFALNTKKGNPKGAVFMCNKIEEYISQYDDYIELTTKIRNNVKSYEKYKKEVLCYIYSTDFQNAYNENRYLEVLSKRYGDDMAQNLLK